MSGRTCSAGGFSNQPASQTLLEHNATVYASARSKSKTEAAIAEIKAATGKEAIFLELDLSSLDSVKKAAQEFLSKEQELHILFNNAYAHPTVVPTRG